MSKKEKHNHKKWDDYAKASGTTYFPEQILLKHSRQKILDIGCGLGEHLSLLGKRKLKVGIEISPHRIKIATKLHKHDATLFEVGNAYRLAYADHAFDTVIMIDVIEHLENPEEALKEIKRVLEPGGTLILQTPNYPVKRVYDFGMRLMGKRKSLSDDPTHIAKFNCFKLKRMLGKHFAIIDIIPRNLLLERKEMNSKLRRFKLFSRLIAQKNIWICRKNDAVNNS